MLPSRAMRDALAGQPIERCVDRDGIGRGVAEIDRRRLGRSRPACRGSRRCLPACAQIWRRKSTVELLPLVPVTRDDRLRPARIEPRRRQRQRTARIGADRHAPDRFATSPADRIATAPAASSLADELAAVPRRRPSARQTESRAALCGYRRWRPRSPGCAPTRAHPHRTGPPISCAGLQDSHGDSPPIFVGATPSNGAIRAATRPTTGAATAPPVARLP